MKWYKIFSLIERILLTAIRDHKFLFIVIISPFIILFVFSIVYKPEINEVNIAIVDLQVEKLKEINVLDSIVKYMNEKINKLNIVKFTSSDEANYYFKKGKIDAIMIFPENLDQSVYLKTLGVPIDNPAEIILITDETNKLLSSMIEAGLESSIIKLSQSFGIEPAVVYSKKPFYENKNSSNNYWAAAIISFSIFVLSLIFSISFFSNEKNSGILESILSSSMSSLQIITGYFISFIIINLFQILILLLTYILFFKGIISISFFYIFILMFLLSSAGTLLGILISCYFNSSIRSFQIAVIIILISLLLSGIFWPTSSLPATGKIISYIFPTTFTIESIVNILTKNFGFINILPTIFILLFFCIIYYFLAAILIRKISD
ncbi:MAG: ABC transporter permease [Exilispira sp.]